ncbi:hypothetical protein J23TS9_10040 [Paenibacillus sp. J23TS9]|uniref:hypothetical protein n=1 Tax=Paenibacillus sp. J23TS9 TaxID=2807193 RepID=UPI001B1289DE|nr:hypothetical protein [Paenibacillus sp. J23TS9]GIP25874.1 hypothetical protein J23TS9_10040 [Paenibacillus sp. J23TS9]
MDFIFDTDDIYVAESGWKKISADQISNDGHSVTISNINGYARDVAFQLVNLVIPSPGRYDIKFKADADGINVGKDFSDEQSITLISVPPAL